MGEEDRSATVVVGRADRSPPSPTKIKRPTVAADCLLFELRQATPTNPERSRVGELPVSSLFAT